MNQALTDFRGPSVVVVASSVAIEYERVSRIDNLPFFL
jgi:hypothetical protein